MIYRIKIILFLFIYLTNYTYAKNKSDINTLNKCIPSKNIIDNYEPIKFNLTNNLIHSSQLGQDPVTMPKLIIFGKLVDKNCIPISNATIYAWQVGPDGKYHYDPLRKHAVNYGLFSNKKSNFIGSALTTTDNNGNFVLITTYPKISVSNTSKGINIRAEHKDLGQIQTRFEFLPIYEEVRPINYLSTYKSDMDESVKAYNLKIVMPATVKFLKY